MKGLAFAIIRDVSDEQQRQAELKASERRLAEALRVAEASIQAKRIFLANMTHELRTPLNAIIGFAELIEQEIQGPHSNPSYKEYGTLIRSAGEHLLSIVNDLLDLSSLEMGKVQLHEELIRISVLAAECKGMLTPTLERAGLRLDLDVPDSMVIRADRRAVKQMLLNLIANAIKFTKSGGTVAVTAGMEAGRPVITVTDSGRGIAADRLQHITEPFGDEGIGYRRKNGGTGIGLSITKALMEQHGGGIEIESALGKGTVVRLQFSPQSAVAGAGRSSRQP
jgi:signal transduction histidine kinase